MGTILRKLSIAFLVATIIAGMPAGPVSAQAAKPTGPATEQQRDTEVQTAFAEAFKLATTGPARIPLPPQGSLALPDGYLFVPKTPGDRLMRALGNRTGETFLGLVIPAKDPQWFATLNFEKVGYVKDDDAKTWNADELLQGLKNGTEAGNSDRAERGFPPIEVTGWVEVPTYDSPNHRLVWAAGVRRKGTTAIGSVNYNTYALGREGYFELNMIGAADVIVKEKAQAKLLLAGLSYGPGLAYGDFNPSTDRVAEYGLAALVGGAVAKKLGLLAVIFALIAKGGKLVVVLGLGLLAGVTALFRSLFGRKSPEA